MAQEHREPVTDPTVSSYKGNPTLTLPMPATDKAKAWEFSFGVRKARAILDNIAAIENFVDALTESDRR